MNSKRGLFGRVFNWIKEKIVDVARLVFVPPTPVMVVEDDGYNSTSDDSQEIDRTIPTDSELEIQDVISKIKKHIRKIKDGKTTEGITIEFYEPQNYASVEKINEEITTLLKRLNGKMFFTLKFQTSDGETKHISGVFNDENVFSRIKNEFIFNQSKNIRTSDDSVAQPGVRMLAINIEMIKRPDKTNSVRQGAFFPFTNQTGIELTEYQIFQKNDIKNIRDNCFIYALTHSKNIKLTKNQVNDLRIMVKTKDLPIKSIKKIADHMNVSFTIKVLQPAGGNKTIRINRSADKVVKLGLISGHYFALNETKYTYFAITHWNGIKDMGDEARMFTRVRNTPVGPQYSSEKGAKRADSFKVIKFMYTHGMFTPMTLRQLALVKPKNKVDITELYYPKEDAHPVKYRAKKPFDDRLTYFADFETTTDGAYHQAFSAAVVDINGVVKSWYGKDCVFKLLDFLPDESTCLFHNLGYDYLQIIDNVKTLSIIKKGSMIKHVSTIYNTKRITFKDSYAMIPFALSMFKVSFGLKDDEVKEVFPYNYYSEKRVYSEDGDSLAFVSTFISSDEDRKQFINNCHHLNMSNGIFNKKSYVRYYCERDVVVLRAGYLKFRGDMMVITGLDILNYVSLPSVAHTFLLKSGCYDGCYELANTPQSFINRSILGGRVMLRKNEKQHVVGEPLVDFDAVSLYPSAMHLTDVVPVGKPHVLYPDELDIISKNPKDYKNPFFVEISIESVGVDLDFPILYNRDIKTGVLEYTNHPTNNLFVVSNYYLDDLIEMQKITYKVIRGYGFDGVNDTIKTVILGLFNERLIKKQEHNPIQNTYKLILNSSYGKTILKPIDTDLVIKKAQSLNKYIYRNYNRIIYIEPTPTSKHYIIKLTKPTVNHFNMVQVGSRVLEGSKLLMNRLFYTAHLAGMPIYYQDTDSIHIKRKFIPELEQRFKHQFGLKLIGVDLGQFHSDFDMSGATGEVFSTEFIGLGKKCYVDHLSDGNGHEGYHIRMKGVSGFAVKNKADNYPDGIIGLYKSLYSGKAAVFEMVDDDHKKFDRTRGFGIKTLTTFRRRIQFK